MIGDQVLKSNTMNIALLLVYLTLVYILNIWNCCFIDLCFFSFSFNSPEELNVLHLWWFTSIDLCIAWPKRDLKIQFLSFYLNCAIDLHYIKMYNTIFLQQLKETRDTTRTRKYGKEGQEDAMYMNWFVLQFKIKSNGNLAIAFKLSTMRKNNSIYSFWYFLLGASELCQYIQIGSTCALTMIATE